MLDEGCGTKGTVYHVVNLDLLYYVILFVILSFYINMIIFIFNYLTIYTVIIFLIFIIFVSFICLFINFSYLKEERI